MKTYLMMKQLCQVVVVVSACVIHVQEKYVTSCTIIILKNYLTN